MRIYIKQNTYYYSYVKYTLKVIQKNRNSVFTEVDKAELADLIWDNSHEATQPIALEFYTKVSQGESLSHKSVFTDSPIIKDIDGREDLMATLFYLINALQERNPEENDLDSLGRFKYSASYQYRFKNIEENLCEKLIDKFCSLHGISSQKKKSTFFISHDIDSLYGSLIQDGFWAIKNLNIGAMLNILALELSRNPSWRNIDKITKINSEYDIKSTFFWLVNKGVSQKNGVKNADYHIHKERNLLDHVIETGNINGLHKSCSDMSIDDELEKGKLSVTANRYHYLKFLPHTNWRELSESRISFDGSLGFAEHYGYRNSYGRAFQPFDIDQNQPFEFIAAPLTFMDTTFKNYLKTTPSEVAKIIIDFYENNSENCDISLLWHNNYFSEYKYNAYLSEYKKVMSYIYENRIECLTPKELVDANKLEW